LFLSQEVWSKAKGSIAKERAELEAYIRNSEDAATVTTIEPWDWRYYAEKVRIQNYTLDFNELKPYFTLSNMLASLMNVANRLFGLEFVERPTLPTYHSSVKTYEVYVNPKEAGQERELVGIFISDNYARAFKHSGAWMSNYREQGFNHSTYSRIIPIVVNNNNFNPPVVQAETNSSETFVSIDDAITLFHEFGHGLHGLLSNVPYGRLAGTCVLRDFVELPSQLFEHWALEKEQLQVFAKHFQTKEPVPMELIEKLLKARKFNQGFQTVEYTASALVDIMLHMQNHSAGDVDLLAFEKRVLGELGMPNGVVMRHRLPHFQRKLHFEVF
jgi:peptidyl-dipeptidase Dcp